MVHIIKSIFKKTAAHEDLCFPLKHMHIAFTYVTDICTGWKLIRGFMSPEWETKEKILHDKRKYIHFRSVYKHSAHGR